MKTKRERSKERLLHILAAIDKISLYTYNVTKHQFLTDERLQDSVLLQFSIIGEAVVYVGGDILNSYDYPWHEVRALRNVIAHEYFGIKMPKIWSTIVDDLPGLRKMILAVKMNGFQIGLVNYAKKMQGTQIGLINIGQGVRKAGEKQGTYIGLINVGDVLNLIVYSSELFLLNTALFTGVLKNGQIEEDYKNKYLLNGLTWSKYPANSSFQDSWAIGYGITRLLFNRNTIPDLNERYFHGYHFRFYHISTSKSFDWNLNEILQIGINAGFKVHPKVGIYGFVSLNLNTHIVGDTHPEQTQDMIPVGIQFMNEGNEVTIGPGINLGLLVH